MKVEVLVTVEVELPEGMTNKEAAILLHQNAEILINTIGVGMLVEGSDLEVVNKSIFVKVKP